MAEPKPKRSKVTEQTDAGGAQMGQATALNFETSIQRLGEIVESLEAGELPLEESLRLFEEGIKLARSSQKVLAHAEERVEQLLSVTEDGRPIVKEIEVE